MKRALAAALWLSAGCWRSFTVGVIPAPDAAALDRPALDEGDLAMDAGRGDGGLDAPDAARAEDAIEEVAAPCGAGEMRCGGACVTAVDNAEHCGRCFNRCRRGCRGDECGETIRELSLGVFHSCILLVSGELYCWGRGVEGQLGYGGVAVSVPPVLQVVDGFDVDQVVAGESHTCARRQGATMSCWGANGAGQLGNGTLTDSLVPRPVRALTNVQLIAVGLGFSCAVDVRGEVKCWGANDRGQLGLGTRDPVSAPGYYIASFDHVAEIGGGRSHACAVRGVPAPTSTVWCWGDNAEGALGTGAVGPPAQLPTRVRGLDDVAHVGAGASHTCALTTDGRVWCWGNNRFGQLGDGTREPRPSPVRVRDLENIRQLAVAPGQNFSCALDDRGQAWCWGDNSLGQLGRGSTSPSGEASEPAIVPLASRVRHLRAGGSRACAVLEGSRRVFCWGSNDSETIGPQGSTPRLVPTPREVAIPETGAP